MRKSFVASVSAFALLAGAAQAADMATKAPPTPGYPSSTGAGCFGGLGSEATVASASVAGTQLYDAGASILVAGGCQFQVRGDWAAVEITGAYQNINGTTVTPLGSGSISSNWSFSQGVIFGFPWTQVFSYLPSLTAIFGTNPVVPLPSGVTPVSSAPFLGVWLDEAQQNAAVAALTGQSTGSRYQLTPAAGLGMINYLGNGVVANARIKYEFPNSSFNLTGGGVANGGGALKAGVIFYY